MRLGSKRYITNKKKISKLLTVFAMLFFFSLSAVYVLGVMRPAFKNLAENRAREIAVYTINKTISDKISNENTEYSDIVQFERDNENRINAVKSNLAGISKLKSDLNLEISKEISAIEESFLKVPLGSLTGSTLFAGMGPDISFRIKPYGNAVCDINTEFTDMGINQTKLDVTVTVKADLSVLMPTMQKKSTVSTSVPIISTVIVGNVPNSFTHVDRDGLEYEDDVLQLAE